jgi:hypothetical protein
MLDRALGEMSVDAFEQVMAAILELHGYWTKTSLHVELTKAQKRAIGRHSSPRWELDVVGYRGRDNHLLVLECKSFMDSSGVRVATFETQASDDHKRYKLFFERQLRDIVLGALVEQLESGKYCPPNPTVVLGLAAGKVHGDVKRLQAVFDEQGWELWRPDQIHKELVRLRDTKYENSIVSVVAKIITLGLPDESA